MSLVVAYKRDGIVYMGADTQCTCGSDIERNLNPSGYKISRLANGCLIGVCGRVKARQKVVAHKKWFDIPENGAFDKRYIVKNIIPELCVLMKDINDDKDALNSSMEAEFIIAYRDKMFVITRNFSVFECGDFAAIGAGEDYSRYELLQIADKDDVNEGLLKALRTAAEFCATVSAPFVFIDTKNKEYKLTEG